MERLYIVTLWKYEDLEDLYLEMENLGIRLDKKREMSRNTYYWMTESQVDNLKSDSRIRNIELHPNELEVIVKPTYDPYTISNGNFYKDDQSLPSNSSYRDWGKLFCAGTESQRAKGVWGSDSTGNQIKTDTVTIFGDGKDVDIVIVDDAASYDCEEWKSPTTGLTRFVQYDWYEELRQYVPTLPAGSYNSNYISNATNTNYHGTHVMSTAGGQHYGWAREANLYNFAYINVQTSVDQGETMDMLRAFHKHKPINATTGRRNPTVTNHSYGSFYSGLGGKDTYPNQLTSYTSNGVTYNSSNPPPNGWNSVGLSTHFNIDHRLKNEPVLNTSVTSDIEDAIADGVVLIGAAGNSNYYQVDPDHPEYNDTASFGYNSYTTRKLQGINDSFTLYPKRGSSPTANGMIVVGAINETRYNRRAEFSNYGPGIHLYAPGTFILGAFRQANGVADTKYGGNNYYRAISGTSMASPQVCGVAACLASGKERFTQDDMLDYIEQYSWDIGSDNNTEMSFNGEHNSGTGEFEINYTTAPADVYSMRRFVLPLAPYTAGISTGLMGGTPFYWTTSTDSIYPRTARFAGYQDRFIGFTTEEYYSLTKPEDGRVIQIWEGDELAIHYPPKICMFDCSSSNTSNGWTFGQPLESLHEDATDPAADDIPPPNQWFDRTNRDYSTPVTGNPTINLVVGDHLVIDTGSANSSHPFWIKTALGSGSTNAISEFYVFNNGGQGTSSTTGLFATYMNGLRNGQIVLHTEFMSPGTYYYQCGNHPNMNGEINLISHATAFSSKRVFFKTATSVDSTSDLITGTYVKNQGAYVKYTTDVFDDLMSWQTRPGDAGTYYLQCESADWHWQIDVLKYPYAGSFYDLSCNKDGPTRFLRSTSPRPTSGNVSHVPVGRRNKSTTKMKYPRKSTVFRGE